jgi:hypothetical protein
MVSFLPADLGFDSRIQRTLVHMTPVPTTVRYLDSDNVERTGTGTCGELAQSRHSLPRTAFAHRRERTGRPRLGTRYNRPKSSDFLAANSSWDRMPLRSNSANRSIFAKISVS